MIHADTLYTSLFCYPKQCQHLHLTKPLITLIFYRFLLAEKLVVIYKINFRFLKCFHSAYVQHWSQVKKTKKQRCECIRASVRHKEGGGCLSHLENLVLFDLSCIQTKFISHLSSLTCQVDSFNTTVLQSNQTEEAVLNKN